MVTCKRLQAIGGLDAFGPALYGQEHPETIENMRGRPRTGSERIRFRRRGKEFIRLLDGHELPRKDLAEHLGVSRGHLNNLLAARVTTTDRHMDRIEQWIHGEIAKRKEAMKVARRQRT
jgi:predicted DNA-binding protein (UPF0251 family)